MTVRFVWALLAMLMGAIPAAAAATSSGRAWVDPGWRRTVARQTVTFDQRGFATTVVEVEFLATTERGADAIAQRLVPYNSYFGELALSNLTTIKADGRIIPVDPRAVRDQPASTDLSSPYFDEERNKIVIYSDVAIGDKVTARAVYTDKVAHFPGQFAQFWVQSIEQPPEVFELTLDGPASMPLRTSGRNVEHHQEQRGDRIIHRVRFLQEMPQPPSDQIDAFDTGARFEASTFPDYQALAGMLSARNAPMARPTEALRSVAADIVGDAATSAVKVERLHNWVTQNIRYVGIGLEDGGLASQPAEAVLSARYGDCKAHATLLKALLATQGIAADVVIVNGAPRYQITEVATQNFDHAILYVPELDRYLDPTASLIAFGALPPELGGKPALDIDTGKLVTIPVLPADRFAIAADTEVTLAADGTRQGKYVWSGRGLGAAVGRKTARRLERMDGERRAAEMRGSDLDGVTDYLIPDSRKLTDDYAITTKLRLKPLALDSLPRTTLTVLSEPQTSALQIPADAREQPFRCQSTQYLETAALHLPDGVSLSDKRAPMAYAAELNGKTLYGPVHGRIEAEGEVLLDGRTVRLRMRLQLSVDASLCPPDFVDGIQAALTRFDNFRRTKVGLTTHPVGYVLETSPEFEFGTAAFDRKDYETALTRFRLLAEKGHPRAQAYIGFMHEFAYGVVRDYGEAARWYRRAAEQGDTYSQSKLADLYSKGLGVQQDNKAAADWYTRAAELGDRQARLHLGTLYRDGRGVPRNFRLAEKWFALAAEQGSGWAQMSIGVLYTHGGDGIPQDYIKAVEWFRKAAARGDAYAEYNLGWAHENGLGVEKNREQAVEWYRKAADQGDQLAKQRLDRLTARETGSSWTPARLIERMLGLAF